MSKALRLSEKWFQRGLWLVALVFAAFLIGLGGTVVGDLPQVEKSLTLDDFIEQPATTQLRDGLKAAERTGRDAQEALEQARLKLRAAQANSRSASETFSNWLATRRATQQPEQDTELIARTAALDALRQAERDALATMETQQLAALDASQAERRARGDQPHRGSSRFVVEGAHHGQHGQRRQGNGDVAAVEDLAVGLGSEPQEHHRRHRGDTTNRSICGGVGDDPMDHPADQDSEEHHPCGHQEPEILLVAADGVAGPVHPHPYRALVIDGGDVERVTGVGEPAGHHPVLRSVVAWCRPFDREERRHRTERCTEREQRASEIHLIRSAGPGAL